MPEVSRGKIGRRRAPMLQPPASALLGVGVDGWSGGCCVAAPLSLRRRCVGGSWLLSFVGPVSCVQEVISLLSVEAVSPRHHLAPTVQAVSYCRMKGLGVLRHRFASLAVRPRCVYEQ